MRVPISSSGSQRTALQSGLSPFTFTWALEITTHDARVSRQTANDFLAEPACLGFCLFNRNLFQLHKHAIERQYFISTFKESCYFVATVL